MISAHYLYSCTHLEHLPEHTFRASASFYTHAFHLLLHLPCIALLRFAGFCLCLPATPLFSRRPAPHMPNAGLTTAVMNHAVTHTSPSRLDAVCTWTRSPTYLSRRVIPLLYTCWFLHYMVGSHRASPAAILYRTVLSPSLPHSTYHSGLVYLLPPFWFSACSSTPPRYLSGFMLSVCTPLSLRLLTLYVFLTSPATFAFSTHVFWSPFPHGTRACTYTSRLPLALSSLSFLSSRCTELSFPTTSAIPDPTLGRLECRDKSHGPSLNSLAFLEDFLTPHKVASFGWGARSGSRYISPGTVPLPFTIPSGEHTPRTVKHTFGRLDVTPERTRHHSRFPTPSRMQIR